MLTSVRHPYHYDLSISYQRLAVLAQEEGESLRERNSATTTALKAASEALGECQAQLENYESQVRCLTTTGPGGHAGMGMTGAHARVPAGQLYVPMVVGCYIGGRPLNDGMAVLRSTQLARLKEQVGAMEAELLAHRQLEAQDREQALEVC
jgi:hypothetical protein